MDNASLKTCSIRRHKSPACNRTDGRFAPVRGEPILQITQVRSNDENQLAFRITITQGASQIQTEEDLLEHIKNSSPAQKGITNVQQLSSFIWMISCNNN
jgi:hypothetical protein